MYKQGKELLEVENLSIVFRSRKGLVRAIRDVSLTIRHGESYALIGESGSGKSTVAFAILNYLAANGIVASGQIWYRDSNLLEKSHEELQTIRGNKISMVFQDPHTSLNPAYTIGNQLVETICRHQGIGAKAALDQAVEFLEAVQLPDPERLLDQYPHQLSGGQKQRAVIAQALSCRPELLILDEPTTALDVTIELRFLDLLADLRKRFQTAFLYITHDLGIVARIADRIGVLYAGQIVEEGSTKDIFNAPAHPYTVALMQSIPDIRASGGRLHAIPGLMPSLLTIPDGCIFESRCRLAESDCITRKLPRRAVSQGHWTTCPLWRKLPWLSRPEAAAELAVPMQIKLTDSNAQLKAEDVRSYYISQPSLLNRLAGRKRHKVLAVDGLTFDIQIDECFGLVGESGCGKSTIGRVIVRLQELTAGRITFEGRDLLSYAPGDREFRKRLQIIFQNPDSSLNPRQKVKTILARPLKLFGLADHSQAIRAKCIELLEMVRLSSDYLHRFPHEMSGGEKQRVAIARAFASRPAFIVCDEVTSALDVSVQASMVNLLMDLKKKFHTSYLFISHDLNIVRQLSDRIAVMYLGKFVEVGFTAQVFHPPYHPYTRALLSAVSIPSLVQNKEIVMLEGTIPSAADPPAGCRFHTRCPQFMGPICKQAEPTLREIEPGHFMACHIPQTVLAAAPPIF